MHSTSPPSLPCRGKRTILVGMDLRKPKSPERMELNSNVGVSNFLIGAVELKEVIQKSGVENLDIVLSGLSHPIPPNC